MEPIFDATRTWHTAHPGATVGALVLRDVANPPHHPALERVIADLEGELRARFAGATRDELLATPSLPAYAAYFKRFGQRYHVAMQLQSVAQKGKPLPRVAALVTAMFAAELRHLVLVAGHDLDQLVPPLRIDVGTGTERFSGPRGDETTVKRGDMYCADAEGVLSAVVTGPAARARILPATRAALFVAYAPPGVPAEAVAALLAQIESAAHLITGRSPAADTMLITAAVAATASDA